MAKKRQETAECAMITHITLLQFKAKTTDEALASVFKEVHALQKHIPCIISVCTGENHSAHHRGFTHGILVHFEDEAHMQDALTHPTYQKTQQKASSLCEQTITFDLPETLPLPVVLASPPQEVSPGSMQRGSRHKAILPAPEPVAEIQPSEPVRGLVQKYPCERPIPASSRS